MPVNTTLADTSNGLLLSAVVLYALAMLCYAGDLAFARHRVMAGIATARVGRAAAVPELVGAAAGAPVAPGPAASAGDGSGMAVSARDVSA
ncbi:MAG: hypothetical protein WAL16_16770, partial [Streptosporangiaceae bacterium]